MLSRSSLTFHANYADTASGTADRYLNPTMPLPIQAALALFLTSCVVFDLAVRRIPNYLSASAILLGLLVNAYYFGIAGFSAGLAGMFLMVGLLLAPFASGGIGAGDVKMMAAVGALVGPRLAVVALLSGMMLGGVVAVLHLARIGRLTEKLEIIRTGIVTAVVARSLGPLRLSADAPDAVALPYGVPLALGTVAAMILSQIGRQAS